MANWRNPAWLSRRAIWEILHAADTDPAPRRTSPTWQQFLHAQATGSSQAAFLNLDTVLPKRIYVLVFIGHGTPPDAPLRGHRQADGRADRAARPATSPSASTSGSRHQFPDPRPGTELHRLIQRRLPGHRDHDPAHRRPGSVHERHLRAAHWHRAHELIGRVLILGERHLRDVLAEYQAHYNTAQPQQGIAQQTPR